MDDGDEVYYIRCLDKKKKRDALKKRAVIHHAAEYKRHSSLLKVEMKRVI